MTRVALCGPSFARAAEILGLDPVEEAPDLVLVDLAQAAGIERAASFDAAIPRVVVPSSTTATLLRSLGTGPLRIAPGATAAELGPILAAALPRPRAQATRTIVITGIAGGCGRTLLAVGVAARLAARAPVMLIDATGSGAAGWWVGVEPSPWNDLEGLVDELTAEHLAIVAAETGQLRVVGGRGPMPSAELILATVWSARDLAALTIVDAPLCFDPRTRALTRQADRVLLLADGSPISVAQLTSIDPDRTWWVIGSRTKAERIGDRSALRSLPDDPSAVRAAARGPAPVGGPLGRAYDDLAELIAVDIKE